MNTVTFGSLRKKNADAISLKLFLVLFVFFFTVIAQSTGPTSYGGIQITPTITSPVNQWSSIPASVKVVLANGTTDTSFSGSVSLGGATGTETYQFQDDFETTITYSTTLGTGTTLSYDTTITATNSSRSGKLTGGTQTHLDGPFYNFGSQLKPVRYSCYMRSTSTTKTGPIVSMVELDSGTYYTAANVMFDSNGRIRMRRCTDSFCDYAYSSGVPYVANQWYKIDVVINWSTSTVDLWVDDIQRDVGFPFMYGTSTLTMRGICYYLYDSGVTGWVDNVKVIAAEGTPTSVSVSPSTLNIVNGIWNGNLQVLTAGANSMYFRAIYSSGTTQRKEGRSNTINSVAGCTPGQYSVYYYSPCVNCLAGSYSTTNGASGCTSCSPGTYQNLQGQTSCTNCSANFYNPNPGSTSSSACVACTFPQISDPGSANCSSCKPGEYINLGICRGCPNGTYGIGGPSCPACPPGTYNSLTNQSSCATCPSGYVYAGQGATSVSNCTACPAGTYAVNSTTCLDCGLGTWNNLTGQTSCFSCPAGTYNNLTKRTSFSDCIPCTYGSHSSLNGSTGCSPCDIGTYANVTGLGQDSCQPCDPGTASNVVGEDSCDPCAAGWFANNLGLTTCTKCYIGTYANSTGTANCFSCSANYTTLSDGSDSESDCILKCGDGQLETGEYCDDGNHKSGDGCSSDCVIEPGYVCINPGQLCERQSTSGGGGGAKKNNAAIAAAVIGAIVLILCVVGVIVGVMLYRRRNAQQKDNRKSTVDMPMKAANEMETESYRRIPSIAMMHSPIVRQTLERGSIRSDSNSAESIMLPRERMSDKNTILYSELDTTESEVVGKGAFGVVFSAKWRGQKVAVKEIKSENISEDDVRKFIEEAELMKNLKPHANVVLFMGVILNPFCIVTEFLEGGDLHTFLKSDSKIPVELQIGIIKDIARGMFHLALEGIVHRDLAARNVLLTRDFSAKVSDFGLSRIADADNVIYSKSDIGPLKWMAPEAIRRKKYSEKSDVWAFGVTCWEIVSREEPFKDMDAVQVATAVVGEGLRPEIPRSTPPQLADIISATWETDPDLRPTFHQLVGLLDALKVASPRK